MKIKLKAAGLALGAVLLAAAPAMASAERIYYLVGTRHVFRVGPDPYMDVDQREQIEQQYATTVQQAKSDFDNAVNGGMDPAQASDALNQQLSDAAGYRDYQLSQLFAPADGLLASHPELVIDGDGPYQVIGVNVANHVWVNYYVMAPWPGYHLSFYPYGWVYGRVYDPYAFHHAYLGWYSGWRAGGAPLFVGLYGGGGFINIGFSASINIALRAHGFAPGPGFHPGYNWHGSIPHGGFGGHGSFAGGYHPVNHFTAVRGGGSFGRPGMSRAGGNFARPGATRPGFTRPMAGARPGFSRPSSTTNRGSFGHSTPSRPSSSFGRPSGGSFGHSAPSRPSGGFTRPRGGSFGHSAPSRPSGGFSRPSGGSFGHSAPSRPSGGSNRRH